MTAPEPIRARTPPPDERRTVAGLLGAVGVDGVGGLGERIRAAAVLEVLRGDLPAARARVAGHRERPDDGDGPAWIDAFAAWLAQAPGLATGRAAGG